MGTLTAKDLEVLGAQSEKTLAEWWCKLNSWGWVDALEDPPPAYGSGDEWRKNQPDKRELVMNWISEKVGHKATSKEWNVNHLHVDHRMTEAQFEEWYTGIHGIHGK